MTKKIYPYVDMTRANADGSHPVYIIVKGTRGRFFVNTGITTCDRLVERTFPKSDQNWKRKTTILGRYMADVEGICIDAGIAGMSDADLKERIQLEVFGVEARKRAQTLADVVRLFAATKLDHTRAIYENTARKVESFDRAATLDADEEWLGRFSSHCSATMSVNGVAKELRNIRAVFNWARRKGMTRNYPFLDFRIRHEETVPNNFSADDIRRLRDYPCETWQRQYVDFFMLSFYLAGINPVDLLRLRRCDLKDGHVSFVRTKTNKQGSQAVRTITLPVLPEAQAIIDRYPSREGWLLGFMDSRSDYRSFARVCNDALQKVGPSRKVKDRVGKLRKMEYSPVCPGITLFGSIAANDLDIGERTIGMCLGHSWARNVTCRYMAHDQRKVDEAVRKVVGYVAGRQGLPHPKDCRTEAPAPASAGNRP